MRRSPRHRACRRDPKLFPPPMKLCREMIEGMGGTDSEARSQSSLRSVLLLRFAAISSCVRKEVG